MTKTIKEIKTKIDSVENYKLLSEEYVNAKSKLEILHESCGDVFPMNWDNFKQGRRCPGCSHKKMGLDQTLPFETIKTKIDSVENYKLLSDEYVNAKSKLKILHYSCGDVFQMTWNDFSQGQRCPKCRIKNNRGENNPNWNPNLTDEEREQGRKLQIRELTEWIKEVFKRDNHTCQCCNVRGGLLEAHHIDSWKEHKDDRFNIDNGVTLCKTCHKACHSYHKRCHHFLATYKLFYEWMAKYSVIKPENWLWTVRYPDAMNNRLKFFKRAS